MQEQIISFETAKLAKKKGFVLGTIGSHVYNYYEDDGRDGYISWGHLHINSPAKAPQSLLQKWLREKHKMYVSVEFGVNNDPNKYAAILGGFGKKGIFMPIMKDGFTIVDSWEEALEEGLQEALKLIKT